MCTILQTICVLSFFNWPCMLCAFCYRNFKISNSGKFFAARGIHINIITTFPPNSFFLCTLNKNLQPTLEHLLMYYVVKSESEKNSVEWQCGMKSHDQRVSLHRTGVGGNVIPGALLFKNHYCFSCFFFRSAHFPWVIMYIQSLLCIETQDSLLLIY